MTKELPRSVLASAVFGLLIAGPAMTVVLSVLGGFVLESLWGWFIVPLGARPLLLFQAMGLSTMNAFFLYAIATSLIRKPDKSEPPSWPSQVATTIFAYACIWGLGWIEHAMMLRYPHPFQ